jgi:DNA-binding NarL/FixJ family response regulator
VIRVLIVAAYAAVRAGLHALLADAEDLAVIGAVSGSAELERILTEAQPDVVLLDDTDGDGPRVVELLSGSRIPTDGGCGLVLLGDQRDGYERLARSALPGWAYLLKEADGQEIAGAVRAVAAGLVVLDRSLSPLLGASPSHSNSVAVGTLPGEALTAREREVLQLMAQGLQNRQIAARLIISPHTVKFHVASILAKLGAASRTEAVTLGARRGDLVL